MRPFDESTLKLAPVMALIAILNSRGYSVTKNPPVIKGSGITLKSLLHKRLTRSDTYRRELAIYVEEVGSYENEVEYKLDVMAHAMGKMKTRPRYPASGMRVPQ